MNLMHVLKQNEDKSMDVALVNGETVTAGSWTVSDELLEAHKQQGFSVYICLDKIVSFKVTER
jgi:hypothetical protein